MIIDQQRGAYVGGEVLVWLGGALAPVNVIPVDSIAATKSTGLGGWVQKAPKVTFDRIFSPRREPTPLPIPAFLEEEEEDLLITLASMVDDF